MTQHERRVALIADAGFYVGPALSRLMAGRGHDLGLGDPAPELVEELTAGGTQGEVVEGARDYGIRFFGIPIGYEFTNLIDSMVVASSGTPSLGAETLERLAGLKERVHIQVFSTPT